MIFFPAFSAGDPAPKPGRAPAAVPAAVQPAARRRNFRRSDLRVLFISVVPFRLYELRTEHESKCRACAWVRRKAITSRPFRKGSFGSIRDSRGGDECCMTVRPAAQPVLRVGLAGVTFMAGLSPVATGAFHAHHSVPCL